LKKHESRTRIRKKRRTNMNMTTKYTIEMEVPAIDGWTEVEVEVAPSCALETTDPELARVGLEFWRRQFPASSFRLIRWEPEEVK
jgi:hypothetical protein